MLKRTKTVRKVKPKMKYILSDAKVDVNVFQKTFETKEPSMKLTGNAPKNTVIGVRAATNNRNLLFLIKGRRVSKITGISQKLCLLKKEDVPKARPESTPKIV